MIPIHWTMEEEDVVRRRILCRVCGAFWTLWLGAYVKQLLLHAQSIALLENLYSEISSTFEWEGNCSHSPLKATTGATTQQKPRLLAVQKPKL